MCSNRAQPNPSRRRLGIEGASKDPYWSQYFLSDTTARRPGSQGHAAKLRLIEEEEPEL